ncbi:hypothetical protein [Alicyclobacillus dauci]|uniref:Uncharacterized protein n=1 Tax=Alicyclobacillus dauci TaxID=1475485 RepID=A0ABY6YXS4_9BACL|nr:hypothetical protein [Alicyclobacillus dauci]WAH35028.1 hypothetical protein NZD86_11880 [Alicyclobacillus dauci]
MTDAQQLDEIRKWCESDEESLFNKRGVRWLLAQFDAEIKRRDEAVAQVAGLRIELDAANQTIQQYEHTLRDNEAYMASQIEPSPPSTIFDELEEAQQKIAEKDAEIERLRNICAGKGAEIKRLNKVLNRYREEIERL